MISPAEHFAQRLRQLVDFSATQFGLADPVRGWWRIDAAESSESYYGRRSAPAPDGETTCYRKQETLPLFEHSPNVDARPVFNIVNFRNHLVGRTTLAVKPAMDNRCLFIDLDRHEHRAFSLITERLIDLRLHFYPLFSGRKGYHFWIFFNQMVSNRYLRQLHEMVCHGVTVDRKVWPLTEGTVKLPLGLHPESRRLAGFVDFNREPIPLGEQFNYFLSIRTNMPPVLPSVLPEPMMATRTYAKKSSEVKCQGDHEKSAEWQISDSECQRIVDEEFVPDELSRILLLFRLTVHLRSRRGLSREEIEEVLFDWSCQVSDRPQRALMYDVRRQVEAAYRVPAPSGIAQCVQLTAQQEECIRAYVTDIIDSLNLDSAQRQMATQHATAIATYLATLLNRNGGRCYVSFTRLAARVAINIKTVHKWIVLLCGSTASPASNGMPAPLYRGSMFIRVARAERFKRKSQEYVWHPAFVAALGRGSDHAVA